VLRNVRVGEFSSRCLERRNDLRQKKYDEQVTPTFLIWIISPHLYISSPDHYLKMAESSCF